MVVQQEGGTHHTRSHTLTFNTVHSVPRLKLFRSPDKVEGVEVEEAGVLVLGTFLALFVPWKVVLQDDT